MKYLAIFITCIIGYTITIIAFKTGITDPGLFWFIGIVTGVIGFGIGYETKEK